MDRNTADDYERFWRDVAAGVGCGQIVLFTARHAGGIVGTAQLHLIGKPNQPHRAEIAKVLVHSRARRQGIGEALMRRAELAAREKGRDLLALDTDENGTARRLYNRLGWTEVGTIPRFALMPDVYFQKGIVLERIGEREAAATEYRNALRARANYTPASAALVQLYIDLGDLKAARTALAEGLKRDPKSKVLAEKKSALAKLEKETR